MRRGRRIVLTSVTALLVVGQLATAARAEGPGDDDPDVSASAGATIPPSYRNPTVELINTDLSANPGDQWNSWCAGVEQSRDSETDIGMFETCSQGNNPGEGWREWDINLLYVNAAGTPIYEIKNPYTGYCLSLEGVESGAVDKPDNGKDAQQEPCERKDDARWWFSGDGHGHVLVRPYLKNSAGRYPCLEADDGDLAGWMQVQIWDCGSSVKREWALSLNDSTTTWPS